MAGEQALGGGGSRAGGKPDLKRAREILAPTGIDHMHAWSMALDLTYAHGWLIAKVASALLQRRELDGDEFLDLIGPAGS
jgi:hypothetical protein